MLIVVDNGLPCELDVVGCCCWGAGVDGGWLGAVVLDENVGCSCRCGGVLFRREGWRASAFTRSRCRGEMLRGGGATGSGTAAVGAGCSGMAIGDCSTGAVATG